METVLPTGVRFSLTRNEHEATFNYEEDFDDVALVARTVDMIAHVLPEGLAVELTNEGKTARIHGTCDYSIIAEMIANEFMHWSRIGEMKLRDILLLGTLAQARNVKAEKALDKALDIVEKGIVADNLRKGAALNAVQIAEKLIEMGG